jgi:uncharacterized protein (DUF433 family)
MSTEIGTLLVSSPDVCGGRLRIEGTRVTINQIATLYKQGFDAEAIGDQYPHLTLAQIYAALAYYHANSEEIEADLTAEGAEGLDECGSSNSSQENQVRLEAFKALQRNLNLTSEKAADWQENVREARR